MNKFNNKNGKHKIRCKNTGKVILEKNYVNNLLHGSYIYYWNNGHIRFKGEFSNNRRTGIWKNYDKNGGLTLREEYNCF